MEMRKKLLGLASVGMIALWTLASAGSLAHSSVTDLAYNARGTSVTANVVAEVANVFATDKAQALTSSGGVVTIETTDLNNVDTSVNNLLKTIFEVLKLLPYMALIIGGFYLLDKLFGILPRPGGGRD